MAMYDGGDLAHVLSGSVIFRVQHEMIVRSLSLVSARDVRLAHNESAALARILGERVSIDGCGYGWLHEVRAKPAAGKLP